MPRAKRAKWFEVLSPRGAWLAPALLAVLFCGESVIAAAGSAATLKDMKKLLKQAIVGGDEAGLVEALKQFAKQKGRAATQAVLETAQALPEVDQNYYWILLESVTAFQGSEAFSEIGDFVVQYRNSAISRDVMHALQKNRSKYVNRVVRRVLSECPLDLQLMAVDLAGMIRVRRTVDVLLPFLAQEDAKSKDGQPTELKTRLIHALEALTLQRFGDNLPNWQGWWNANRQRGLKILREEAEHSEARTGLVQPLDPVRDREFIGLEEIAGKVLVIKGVIARNGVNTNFDHMEDVLERLGLRPDVWEKTRLEEDDCPSLARYAAIFVNCTQINPFCQSPGHTGGEAVGNRLRRCLGPAPHDEFRGKMKDPALQRLRKFVELGGQLFTEDWALIEVIEPLWNDMVSRGESMTDEVVQIRAARGQTSHPLLRGVFVPPIRIENFDWDPESDFEDEEDKGKDYNPGIEDDPGDTDTSRGKTGVGDPAPTEGEEPSLDADIELIKHQWKIDNESPSIRVNSRKVTVLITSETLKEKYGDPAVAVAFPVREGRVVHVLSHFGKQSSSRDEATLENFLVNFLLEVHVRVKKASSQ